MLSDLTFCRWNKIECHLADWELLTVAFYKLNAFYGLGQIFPSAICEVKLAILKATAKASLGHWLK